jgi:hypothetical protein
VSTSEAAQLQRLSAACLEAVGASLNRLIEQRSHSDCPASMAQQVLLPALLLHLHGKGQEADAVGTRIRAHQPAGHSAERATHRDVDNGEWEQVLSVMQSGVREPDGLAGLLSRGTGAAHVQGTAVQRFSCSALLSSDVSEVGAGESVEATESATAGGEEGDMRPDQAITTGAAARVQLLASVTCRAHAAMDDGTHDLRADAAVYVAPSGRIALVQPVAATQPGLAVLLSPAPAGNVRLEQGTPAHWPHGGGEAALNALLLRLSGFRVAVLAQDNWDNMRTLPEAQLQALAAAAAASDQP